MEESRQILTRTGSFDSAQDDIKKVRVGHGWLVRRPRPGILMLSMFRLSGFVKSLLVLSLLAFSQSFSHAVSLPQTASHHAGMSHGQTSSQTPTSPTCQILCATALPAANAAKLTDPERDELDPALLGTPAMPLLALLACLGLVVKLLYGLSSWRPPDKIVAYCHCSDGL